MTYTKHTPPPTASVLIFINSAFQSLLLIFSAPFFSFPFPLQEFSSLFITEIPLVTLLGSSLTVIAYFSYGPGGKVVA